MILQKADLLLTEVRALAVRNQGLRDVFIQEQRKHHQQIHDQQVHIEQLLRELQQQQQHQQQRSVDQQPADSNWTACCSSDKQQREELYPVRILQSRTAGPLPCEATPEAVAGLLSCPTSSIQQVEKQSDNFQWK